MAYSTLLSLESTINQILGDDRFSISPHEKNEIASLEKYVISFQAFLEYFPKKADTLEARIRDVAGKAEDIVEWFLSKHIRYNYGYTKHISALRCIMFKYQLHIVRFQMNSIADEVVKIQNRIANRDIQLGDSTSSSQVPDTGKMDVVGFNEDLKKIKEGLCGWARQLKVLPIFGMGGIGKTTLARNAYNDQLIMERFQIRVWITISQDYSERRILVDLLDCMKEFDLGCVAENSKQGNSKMVERSKRSKESPAEIPEMSNTEMALKVHKILTGRRFLIVIDDIWSTKVLDDVKKLFPDDNNGSRIMLTTRLKEVATYADSSTLPHEMRLLNEDQSWNLLRQKVFAHQYRVPHNLDSIGREIARSCGGLPLAIVVIAGLLSTTNKTITSWEEVARNIRLSLATTDGQIEKILSLSYNHLPHHLRSCFLYMGGFPEDHEIKVTNLIRLWVAESFVKPIVSKELEHTAEEYLEDLVDRSLIVVNKRKPTGQIKSCSLHDMVREMCLKLARKEKFLVHVKGMRAMELLKSMKHRRRISISNSNLNSLTNICSPTVHTIMYFQYQLNSFGGFRLLRVLDLLRARSQSRSLSHQFFKLFHLRYLAFCNSYPIPRAISNLKSLQTLIIKEISDSCLPREIWNMSQLRHLIISGTRVADTNVDTSSLENLQTLRVQDLTCSIRMLKLIPNLTKLWLKYSCGPVELHFHNLVHLNRLEKLHLELHEFDSIPYGKPTLVVPSSLKKLTLIGWGKEECYLDIAGPFPNLEVLKLKRFNFMMQEWRTFDEEFPQLKFLLIENSDLRQWEAERSHFPRLKTLHIHSCVEVIEVPECMGDIPTLELIELKLCTDSLVDSVKRIQVEAQSYDDDAFLLRCIDCMPTEKLSSRLKSQAARKRKLGRQRRLLEGMKGFQILAT